MGEYCFYICPSLQSVRCYATEPPTADNRYIFDDNAYSNLLFVPDESVELYKSTFPWSEFKYIYPISKNDDTMIMGNQTRGMMVQSAGGFINISGLVNNEKVDFYGIDGTALGYATAINGNATFSAKTGSIVIAKIGKKNIKLMVK